MINHEIIVNYIIYLATYVVYFTILVIDTSILNTYQN